MRTVYGCGESAKSPAGHIGVGGRHTSGSSRDPVCVSTAAGLPGTDAASPKPGRLDSCRFGCAQGGPMKNCSIESNRRQELDLQTRGAAPH